MNTNKLKAKFKNATHFSVVIMWLIHFATSPQFLLVIMVLIGLAGAFGSASTAALMIGAKMFDLLEKFEIGGVFTSRLAYGTSWAAGFIFALGIEVVIFIMTMNIMKAVAKMTAEKSEADRRNRDYAPDPNLMNTVKQAKASINIFIAVIFIMNAAGYLIAYFPKMKFQNAAGVVEAVIVITLIAVLSFLASKVPHMLSKFLDVQLADSIVYEAVLQTSQQKQERLASNIEAEESSDDVVHISEYEQRFGS